MSCDIYKGSDFTLIGQFTDADATPRYRSVPGTPAATRLKFSQLSLNRNPMRQTDPTINDNVLNPKTDEVDESPEGSITAIACLNDATFWFNSVFGDPVTTGGAATSAEKSGGNTGTGTLGAVTVDGAKSGVYQLRITAAAADGGTYSVTDPDGAVVDTADVGDVFDAGGLSFTLSDGVTDFVVGDGFDITVAKYVHTYTLSDDCKPDALLELKALRNGAADPRIRRFVGWMTKEWTWDAMADDQNFVYTGLMATSVRPFPTTVFDAAPTKLGKSRALAAKADVYDVDGASTLGEVVGATLNVNLAPNGVKLADGLFGYGAVDPGQVIVNGTLNVRFSDASAIQAAETHASTTLIYKSESADGSSIVLTVPSAEYSEPADEVNQKQGMMRTLNWTAHFNEGDDPITVVLTNDIAAIGA